MSHTQACRDLSLAWQGGIPRAPRGDECEAHTGGGGVALMGQRDVNLPPHPGSGETPPTSAPTLQEAFTPLGLTGSIR